MTATEIRDLLVSLLTGAAGGTAERWTALVGPVEALPIWKNVQSNWRITPSGQPDEMHAIRSAVDLVRAQHPYVDAS